MIGLHWEASPHHASVITNHVCCDTMGSPASNSGNTFKAVIQELELPLVHGDTFLFFTDGISEAMNGASELFGEGRLASILKEANALSSDDLKERILHEVRVFAAGESPHDDMTMVIVKVV